MHFLFLQIPPNLCCEFKDRFTVTKDWHQPCAKYDAQATDLSFNSVSDLQNHSMKNSKETELITKTQLSSLINTRHTCDILPVFSHSWHAKSLLGLINPSMMLKPVTYDVFLKWHGELKPADCHFTTYLEQQLCHFKILCSILRIFYTKNARIA